MKLGRKQRSQDENSSGGSPDLSLVGHLSELRTRLIRSVLAIVIGAIVVYIFNKAIFDFLAEPYYALQESQGEDGDFLIRSPTEPFQIVLSISGYGGMILALPVIFYQLARFILPGLKPNEKKMLIPFVAASIILAFAGMAGGYYLMPKTLDVLLSFGNDSFKELFSPSDYISFFVKMLLAFGISAELPLVLVFLQMVGIVDSDTLRKNRRFAMVAVVILAAVVTPTGDPFTLGVLAIPMYLLYEIAIIIGSRLTRRRGAAA